MQALICDAIPGPQSLEAYDRAHKEPDIEPDMTLYATDRITGYPERLCPICNTPHVLTK